MSRYIDADKIKYYCKQSHECLSNAECEYCDHYKVCKIDIDNIPTEEVKPIVRGKWICANESCAICSKCNRLNEMYGDFCKHCGADMRKESEEGE